MWKVILPEVPKYLWLGKGVGISAAQLDSTTALEGQRASTVAQAEGSILVGNFHSGPLTVLISLASGAPWAGSGFALPSARSTSIVVMGTRPLRE